MILVMDRENYYDVKRLARNSDDVQKIKMLPDFMTRHPGQPTIAGNSLSVEITDARIVSDGVMNLYWHEIYDSKEYYLEMYRGR